MKKAETTNALAIIEDYQLPALNNEMAEAMQEEMDGLSFTFQRVKIPSGGGLTFEVPGDDPETPDTVKEIIGVIVDHHQINAYWENKYSGGNNPPECSSLDNKIGIGEPGGNCKTCPMNQWGSDEESRGKACKNMHRVYILPEGEMIPLLLTIPPTSLKNISDYIANRIVTKGRRTYGVVTKITLKKAQNSGGISYSQAVFSLEGLLSPENTKAMAEYSKGIKVLTRQLEVTDDEYRAPSNTDDDTNYTADPGAATQQAGSSNDDDIPF